MTKEDIKKSILIGVVSGFTATITLLFAVWVHTLILDWYRDYKEKIAIENGATSHCDRPGVKEMAEAFDSLRLAEQE